MSELNGNGCEESVKSKNVALHGGQPGSWPVLGRRGTASRCIDAQFHAKTYNPSCDRH